VSDKSEDSPTIFFFVAKDINFKSCSEDALLFVAKSRSPLPALLLLTLINSQYYHCYQAAGAVVIIGSRLLIESNNE